MLIAKNDEEKRSKLWRIVTIVTSILIVVIAAFFLTKLFTDNPLEGTWKHKDSNLVLNIKGSNMVYVKWDDLYEGSNVEIGMEYALDKEDKTIAFKINEDEILKAVDGFEGQVTADGLKSDLSILETTYAYSIEQKKLILTEREYGEQLVFKKR